MAFYKTCYMCTIGCLLLPNVRGETGQQVNKSTVSGQLADFLPVLFKDLDQYLHRIEFYI